MFAAICEKWRDTRISRREASPCVESISCRHFASQTVEDEFKNANIVASVHTDSGGGQQLAFSSSTSAFQVQAGDQMANALLGNVSVVGGVAKGAACLLY